MIAVLRNEIFAKEIARIHAEAKISAEYGRYCRTSYWEDLPKLTHFEYEVPDPQATLIKLSSSHMGFLLYAISSLMRPIRPPISVNGHEVHV